MQENVGTKDVIVAFARSGGKAILKKYGTQHFRDMANRRWAKIKKKKLRSKVKT